MNLPIISIIVPVFNPPRELLLQCIRSIQEAMSLVPSGSIEVFFVNDGSTNDYVDEVLKCLDGDFYYFKKENGGISSARNMAMEHATGEYLMFMDADDCIERSALLNSFRFIKESRADIIFMGCVKDDRCRDIPQWQEFIEGKDRIRQFIVDMTAGQTEASHHSIFICSSISKLYRKGLIDSCQLRFDPELKVAEDFWFNLCALSSQDCNSLYLNNQLVYHYVSNTQSITRNYSDIRVQMSIAFMNRLDYYLHANMDDDIQFKRAACHQLLLSIRISMRTYFLHPLNPRSLLQKCKELQSYLDNPIMQRWICELTWDDVRKRSDYRDICLLKMRLFWTLLLMTSVKRTIRTQIKKWTKR